MLEEEEPFHVASGIEYYERDTGGGDSMDLIKQAEGNQLVDNTSGMDISLVDCPARLPRPYPFGPEYESSVQKEIAECPHRIPAN